MKREMAERTGLEPATLGVTGRYSNQLNYRSTVEKPDNKTFADIISLGLKLILTCLHLYIYKHQV